MIVYRQARWIGHGGETNFQGSSLETFTWATGLAALTKKICLVVTAHTTVIHPVVSNSGASLHRDADTI